MDYGGPLYVASEQGRNSGPGGIIPYCNYRVSHIKAVKYLIHQRSRVPDAKFHGT